MGRIMGLDFGAKTVGVALTDPMRLIVSPEETIVRDKENKIRPTLRRITELAAEREVDFIVLGHPVNMDDTIGERARKTEEFAALLKRRFYEMGKDFEIVLWDERLSTMEADAVLELSGVRSRERKQYIDKIAAALILEDYLKNGMKNT
ncbi:MAG: Holliday junction resolvase RuvX [Eubacteriales bacterium]|nr:Holliday junction resolvase RuvX [Eubacteriales bacterium]